MGTISGLLEFLDELLKHTSKPGSIIPMQTAARQIFSHTIGTHNFDSVDINTINAEETFYRFRDLTIGNYSHSSYRTYRCRLRKAIRMYTDYLKQKQA